MKCQYIFTAVYRILTSHSYPLVNSALSSRVLKFVLISLDIVCYFTWLLYISYMPSVFNFVCMYFCVLWPWPILFKLTHDSTLRDHSCWDLETRWHAGAWIKVSKCKAILLPHAIYSTCCNVSQLPSDI